MAHKCNQSITPCDHRRGNPAGSQLSVVRLRESFRPHCSQLCHLLLTRVASRGFRCEWVLIASVCCLIFNITVE